MDNKKNDIKDSKMLSQFGSNNQQDVFNSQDDVRKKRKNGRRQTAMHRNRWYDFYLELYRKPQLAVIPAVILLIIILIVVYNKNVKHGAIREDIGVAESVTKEPVTIESISTDETQPETEDPTIVREYYDEYLTAFFEQYFKARLEADTDTLYALTGVSNQTEEQTSLYKTQLQTQAGYIEAYQDIKQYAVNALEENSKLVFVTYNVKFRRVETLAPGIMYCYIKVNDANEFEIVENLSPEQTKFVNDYMTNHEEVQELINSNNSRLLQAITGDERLAVIYDAFQSGRIYTDSQESIDSEVSLIDVDGAEITESTVESTSDNSESTVESASDNSESVAESASDNNESTVENTSE